MNSPSISSSFTCLCGGREFQQVFFYNTPPKLETKFQFSAAQPYQRSVQRCVICGHFFSAHSMDIGSLYSNDYVISTYGGEAGLRQAFQRIISLDPSKSDNSGRVKRIIGFAKQHFDTFSETKIRPTILDVGAGLGVFLYRMKEAGWDCTALDPDSRTIQHIQRVIEVKAIQADFITDQDFGHFDVITFNKVLEHVSEPIGMLAKSRHHLNENGFIYVEVPDGEAACVDGSEREEFAIDHHHIFSFTSLALLVSRAGFFVRSIERLREPSSKFTLRAFLTLK